MFFQISAKAAVEYCSAKSQPFKEEDKCVHALEAEIGHSSSHTVLKISDRSIFFSHSRDSSRAAAEDPVTLDDPTTDHPFTPRTLKLFHMKDLPTTTRRLSKSIFFKDI